MSGKTPSLGRNTILDVWRQAVVVDGQGTVKTGNLLIPKSEQGIVVVGTEEWINTAVEKAGEVTTKAFIGSIGGPEGVAKIVQNGYRELSKERIRG